MTYAEAVELIFSFSDKELVGVKGHYNFHDSVCMLYKGSKTVRFDIIKSNCGQKHAILKTDELNNCRLYLSEVEWFDLT